MYIYICIECMHRVARNGHKLQLASFTRYLPAPFCFYGYIHREHIHSRCHVRLEYKTIIHLLPAIPAVFLDIAIVSNSISEFCIILSHSSPSSRLQGESCTVSTTSHSLFFSGKFNHQHLLLDTFLRTLRNHFLAPARMSNRFLLHRHHLQLPLFVFATLNSNFSAVVEVQHIFFYTAIPLFCWNEFSLSF